MKAYKGFDKDLTCRGFQYEVGKEYETDRAEVCTTGFHACENPIDCFSHYPPGQSVYYKAEQGGEISRSDDDSKIASTRIKIGAKISLREIISATFDFVKKEPIQEKERAIVQRSRRAIGQRSGRAIVQRSRRAMSQRSRRAIVQRSRRAIVQRSRRAIVQRSRRAIGQRSRRAIVQRSRRAIGQSFMQVMVQKFVQDYIPLSLFSFGRTTSSNVLNLQR